MEVCGVGRTTCEYWRQGASILKEVNPEDTDESLLDGINPLMEEGHLLQGTWPPNLEKYDIFRLPSMRTLGEPVFGLGAS